MIALTSQQCSLSTSLPKGDITITTCDRSRSTTSLRMRLSPQIVRRWAAQCPRLTRAEVIAGAGRGSGSPPTTGASTPVCAGHGPTVTRTATPTISPVVIGALGPDDIAVIGHSYGRRNGARFMDPHGTSRVAKPAIISAAPPLTGPPPSTKINSTRFTRLLAHLSRPANTTRGRHEVNRHRDDGDDHLQTRKERICTAPPLTSFDVEAMGRTDRNRRGRPRRLAGRWRCRNTRLVLLRGGA